MNKRRGGGLRAAAADPPQDRVISLERLDELREHLPPDMLRGLMDQCLTELGERLAAFRSALDNGDCAGIKREMHAMAGLAGNFAMTGLHGRLLGMMAAARLDQAAVKAAAADLEAEFARAEEALRKAIAADIV